MKKKRVKILLMTFLLVVGLLAVPVFADDTAPANDDHQIGDSSDDPDDLDDSGYPDDTVLSAVSEHTVTYDPRGGTMASSTTVSIPDGQRISDIGVPDDPKRNDDSQFAGWYTDATFPDDAYFWNFDTVPSQDITLYARYAYHIIYDLKGGSVGGNPPLEDFYVSEGSQETIPTQEELVEGWGIIMPANTRWNGVDIDGVHYNPGDTYTITKPATVIANWVSTLPTPTPATDNNRSSSDNTGTNTSTVTSTNATTTTVTAANTGDGNTAALSATLMLASLLSLAMLIHSRRRVTAGRNR